jgi:hypothetical protein
MLHSAANSSFHEICRYIYQTASLYTLVAAENDQQGLLGIRDMEFEICKLRGRP